MKIINVQSHKALLGRLRRIYRLLSRVTKPTDTQVAAMRTILEEIERHERAKLVPNNDKFIFIRR